MTDDELDRALFALKLEEPPADLHGRILAATVLRPAPAFRAWEIVLLAVAVACAAAFTSWLLHTSPDAGGRLGDAVVAGMHSFGLYSRATYVWFAIGLSSIWWISSLRFMPVRRLPVYNR